MRKYQLIREYYNISQQELADAIGCTHQTISLFEKGKTKDSFVEEFYNHKFLKNLTEKLHGAFLPPFEYVQFVLESLTPEERLHLQESSYPKFDLESSYPKEVIL